MQRKNETARTWSGAATTQDGVVRFVDREHESRRIEDALRNKESLIISGPVDIGKTALVQNVTRKLPQGLARQCLHLSSFKDLQDLLRKLLKLLYDAGNPAVRRQLRAERVSAANFEAWLKAMPSQRLKGTLYRAIESSGYRVILDHVPPLTHAVAKVLKELFGMRNTPVYLVVRDGPERRIDQFSHFFYWGDRERLVLGPLPAPAAHELLESCIERFGLSRLEVGEFKKEVFQLSGCVPGTMVKMCMLAADPRYQYGSRIKTKLVHIDYLMSGSTLMSPVRGAGRRLGDRQED